MRTIRGALDRLSLQWEAELRRLPWFTQRTAVVLLGVLVATRRRRSGIDVALAWPVAPAGPPHARRAYPTGVSAMLGGVVALVGWPGAGGPARLVPVSGPVRLRRPARSLATGPLPGRRGRVPGPGLTPAARRRPPRPQRRAGRREPGAWPPGHRGPAVRPARAPGARQPHRRPRPRRSPPRRAPSTRSTGSSARSCPPCFPRARARPAQAAHFPCWARAQRPSSC